MVTIEYLESILDKAKKYLPDWLMNELHRAAMPASGGKARWRDDNVTFFEKMALKDMNPSKLANASDDEVRQAWLRLNQWYTSAKKKGEAIEDIVNASIFVIDEFDRRGFKYNPDLPLVDEAMKLKEAKKADSIEVKLEQMPDDVVVISDFVSVVGSSVVGNGNDIDILFRADRDESGKYFKIQADNVWLPIRKILNTSKDKKLHFIDSPQGPHDDYIPIYSLVMRKETVGKKVIKGMVKPFGSPGGKTNWLGILLKRIPEHKTYVEPYAGSATLYWAKEPSELEVLNDLDPDIIAIYRFLKNGTDDDFKWMREQNWNGSRETFEELKASRPEILRDKAYRAKYLNYFSQRGSGDVFAEYNKQRGCADFLANLEKYRDRLKNTIILQKDALEVMKEYDSKDTFFYIDPPWKPVSAKNFWKDFNEDEFVKAVKDLKGKALISYQGDLDLGSNFSRYSFEVTRHGFAKPTRQALYWNYDIKKAVDDIDKAELKPIQRYPMPKPAMKTYADTEAFTPEEIWPWVEDHLKNGVVSEMKLNGFHASAQKAGDKVSIWFEDSQEERNKQLPELVEALAKIPDDFILDCDIGIEQKGRRWPRIKLMTLTADKPDIPDDAYPVLTIFDLPYLNESLQDKPFSYRRMKLEEFYNQYLKDDKHFAITDEIKIKSKDDLKRAWQEQGNKYMSEGIVLKDMQAKYTVGMATEGMAKVKKQVEVKAIVLDVKENKNGTYSFRCGLLPGLSNFKNLTTLNGQEYVDLGMCYNAPFKADVGDICTFKVEEIIPNDDTLSWTGARPIDIDKSRSEPYYANQVIDIAKRGGVLQKGIAYVPILKGRDSKIMFIGGYPDDVELARKEAMVGSIGKIFIDRYLIPLRLTKGNVDIAYLYPFEFDGNGKVSDDELAYYIDNIKKESRGKIIIALSQEVRRSLEAEGIIPDYVLPGPLTISKNDSGELERKLKQIRKALEEDTRSAYAERVYKSHWQEMYPKVNNAKWVLQAHWRGLSEEEIKLTHKELLETDHSVHCDLRFQIDNKELWGFSVFEGDTEDIRKTEHGSRLIDLKTDDALQGAFKPFEPIEWLTITDDSPYVSEPGGVGSTSQTYSKFFKLDGGEYILTYAREHGREVVVSGKLLKGRITMDYAPIGEGGRKWLIKRPASQELYIETHNLEDVIKELKDKGQRWLLWYDKKNKKVLTIDIKRDTVKMDMTKDNVKILKADDDKQIVIGIVLEPDSVDSQGETVSADEIEKACYGFMLQDGVIGFQHAGVAKDAHIVENYIAPIDFALNNSKVKKGSWLMGVYVGDKNIWRMIKDGEVTGFSIGGTGTREAIK